MNNGDRTMSNVQRVTYRLNSAPVQNSGHTTDKKKRVMSNYVKWTEINLQAEFSTSAQQWTHTGKKRVMANNFKWTDNNLQPIYKEKNYVKWTGNECTSCINNYFFQNYYLGTIVVDLMSCSLHVNNCAIQVCGFMHGQKSIDYVLAEFAISKV